MKDSQVHDTWVDIKDIITKQSEAAKKTVWNFLTSHLKKIGNHKSNFSKLPKHAQEEITVMVCGRVYSKISEDISLLQYSPVTLLARELQWEMERFKRHRPTIETVEFFDDTTLVSTCTGDVCKLIQEVFEEMHPYNAELLTHFFGIGVQKQSTKELAEASRISVRGMESRIKKAKAEFHKIYTQIIEGEI